MQTTAQFVAANPFALMMDPQSVLDAVEHSSRLGGLQRRVCRPLDKPLIPKRDAAMQAFDAEIDGEDDVELSLDDSDLDGASA